MSELRDLLEKVKQEQQRRKKRRKRHTSFISTNKASKPKALLGTKLTRYEWEWLPYHSPSAWMVEWAAGAESKQKERKEEEKVKKGDTLVNLLLVAKSKVKRGRPRKEKPELVRDPRVQTGYGLKLLELEEKYPVNPYYWNDSPGDPREIPWGDLDDLARLVDRLM